MDLPESSDPRLREQLELLEWVAKCIEEQRAKADARRARTIELQRISQQATLQFIRDSQ